MWHSCEDDNTGHDDGIKWNFFPRYWPFVRGIHRFPVNSPHKDQWRGTLMFSFICVWINGWVNNREAGDLRCYRAHYDVIGMSAQATNCLKGLKFKRSTSSSWVYSIIFPVHEFLLCGGNTAESILSHPENVLYMTTIKMTLRINTYSQRVYDEHNAIFTVEVFSEWEYVISVSNHMVNLCLSEY